jgi:YegS/Rv2252/BmrU family lipid kinase
VKAYFARSKTFEVVEYIVVRELSEFDKSVQKLASMKRVKCVIVCSGDGTIIAILNELKRRKDIVYGFVPLGTSNTFVRSLGLPLDIKKTMRIITEQNVRSASLGSINGRLFANIADIGVPTEVAANTTDKVKKYLGSLAYAVTGIKELAHHNAIWCELTVGKEAKRFYTHQLFVANGRFRGPVRISKDASPYNDHLVLGYSANESRLEFAKDAVSFLTGRSSKRDSLVLMPAKDLRIKTVPRASIQADGEVIGKTPARIKLVEDAIKVFAKPEQPSRQHKSRTNRR